MDEEMLEQALAVLGRRIHRAKFLVAVISLVAAVAGILTMVDQSIKKQLVAEALQLRADIAAARPAPQRKRAAKPAAEGEDA